MLPNKQIDLKNTLVLKGLFVVISNKAVEWTINLIHNFQPWE